jgi:ABC-type transporter Mla subunit MlaD
VYLPRRVVTQMAIFTTGTLVAVSVMAFHYMGLPNYLFGVGHYRVTLHLPAAAGLYSTGNVTYRGTEVGRVEAVELTDTGVDAILSLKSGVAIPADLDAEVHSQTAVGEQFVALRPRSGNGPALKTATSSTRTGPTSRPTSIRYSPPLIGASRRFHTTTSRPSSTRDTPPSADSAQSCLVWLRELPRWPSTRARTSTRWSP